MTSSPGVPQVTDDDPAAEIRASLGEVPPAFQALAAMSPLAAQSFAQQRSELFRQRPDGLSLKHKELLVVLFELIGHNDAGAVRHLAAARRAGLTTVELTELLLMFYLFEGMSAWADIAYRLWSQWQAWDAADSPAAGSASKADR